MSKIVKQVTYHINSPNNSISKKNKVEETQPETTDTESNMIYNDGRK